VAELTHAVNVCQPVLLIADSTCTQYASCAPLAALPCIVLGSQQLLKVEEGATPASTARALITEYQEASTCQREPIAAASGIALICFTSGTSGAAKGVIVTHSALHAQSLAKLAVVGYSEEDVFLHAAPLFHIGGISSALAVLMAGSRHVFLEKYSPALLFSSLSQHRATATIAVPAMLSDILAEADHQQGVAGARATGESSADRAQLQHMRRILIGAGAVEAGLVSRLKLLTPHATIYSAYGLTETASSITFRRVMEPEQVEYGRGTLSACLLQQHNNTLKWVERPAAPELRQEVRGLMALQAGGPRFKDVALSGTCVGWPSPGVQVSVLPLGATAEGACHGTSQGEPSGWMMQSNCLPGQARTSDVGLVLMAEDFSIGA
jgi:acyl-CoA synthetase (AMP-forming)/AMP-acid ligase II